MISARMLLAPTLLGAFCVCAGNTSAQAAAFELDPAFGTGGIATYEWPALNAYQWDGTDAWATHLGNGKWVVGMRLREGNQQRIGVSWFDADGSVTTASPGAGPYTPFIQGFNGGVGIGQSLDGSLTIAGTIFPSGTDHDFALFRSFADGTDGYAGCSGGYLQAIAFNLAAGANYDDAGAFTQDAAGRQIVAGTVQVAGGESRVGVSRVMPGCGLDGSFDLDGKQVIDPNPYIFFPPPRRTRANVVTTDASQRTLIGGNVTWGLNSTDNGSCIVVRLTVDGQRDGSFGNNGVLYIDNFSSSSGNWICDIGGIAVQADGHIIVSGDWKVLNGADRATRNFTRRFDNNGNFDSSYQGCCDVGYTNVDLKDGALALMEADGVVLHVSSSLTLQADVNVADGQLLALSTSDGSYANGFLPAGQLPLGLASTSYHDVIVDTPDTFVVVATTGADLLSHRQVHLLQYRRASTIVYDRIFLNGFE